MTELILATIGGAIIGLAAVLLMATEGKIMGISGIASNLLPPISSDWQWRLSFLGGVLAAPIGYQLLTGAAPEVQITNSSILLVVSGLLVGLGTVIGNGCTSGHGVCGLSRFSVRSLVATGVFMVTAILIVLINRLTTG